MKKFATTFSLILNCLVWAMPHSSNAQTEPCGFGAAMQAEFQQNPAYLTLIEQMEQNPGQGQGPADGTYKIPTVFHIIHNNGSENISDAQVLDALTQANYQLSGGEGGFNTKIQLVLARIDPNGNCSNGINRVQYPVPDADLSNYPTDINIKNLSRWDPSKYLNVWIVRNILPGGNTVGYAYFPGAYSLVDGIVIKHSHLGTTGTASGAISNTLVHEFGHYAFLYHVWGPDWAPCIVQCHDEGDCLTL